MESPPYWEGANEGPASGIASREMEEPGPENVLDVVRQYLLEIGQHHLLKAAEELRLGLAVEVWVQLKEMRTEFERREGRQPLPVEVGSLIVARLATFRDLAHAISTAVEEEPALDSFSRILFLPGVRQVLDTRLKDDMRHVLAEALGIPEEEVRSRVSALSKLSRLLPPDVIERMDSRWHMTEAGDTGELEELLRQVSEQVARWFDRIEAEGRTSAEALTNSNLRLVVSVARKYLRWELPLLDLVQEGNLGLMRAVERFDPHLGFKFSTYATWWIRQALTRALADLGRTIRLPVHVVERLNRLSRAEQTLFSRLDRMPQPEELAQELGWSLDIVLAIQERRQVPTSLEAPVGEVEGSTLADFIQDTSAWSPDELAIRQITRENVIKALEELPPRLKKLLELRFGLCDDRQRTLEEVGRELGVTRERVRQLEQQALNKLRSSRSMPSLQDIDTEPAVHDRLPGGAKVEEQRIGEVIHYFSGLGVAVLRLEAPLKLGDQVHIAGQTTDLEGPGFSMEINHLQVSFAQSGDDVAIKVQGRVRHGDKVYRVITATLAAAA